MSGLKAVLDRLVRDQGTPQDVATLRDVHAIVEEVIKLGRLPRRLRSWAIDYALRDSRGFSEFVKVAPEQPLRSAGYELMALARELSEKSKGTIDLATALNVIVREEPDLADQVQAERNRA